MGKAAREFELKVELAGAEWERLLDNPALRTLADGVSRRIDVGLFRYAALRPAPSWHVAADAPDRERLAADP
jgi:hypothetical protein